MKKILVLFLVILLVKNSFSQAPSWLWAIAPTGGSYYEAGVGISADASGNIFMAGRFNGSITLGTKSASAPNVTTVSGELNSSGTFSWLSAHANFGSIEYVYGFTRDNSNNTYTTGKIRSAAGGIFIDKYSSSGSVTWSDTISNGGIGAGYGIAVDGSGNVYVTGEYSGAVTFGSTTLNSTGNSDIFLAKFNSSGTCQWAVSAGGSGYDGAWGIALDKVGNIYVCGGYSGSASFGSIKPSAATLFYPNFFIAKYNSSGTSQWVSSASNAGFGNNDQFWRMQSIAIDTCANLYVTGNFIGDAAFGNLVVQSFGQEDIFVAKCLGNGQWDWVSRAGGKNGDNGLGITLDKNYDIYLTGSFQDTALFGNQWVIASGLSDVFVAKYSNTSGDVQWVQTGGGKVSDAGLGITLDNNGYAYVIGTSGSGTFGSHNITDATRHGSIFIAKLDTGIPLKIIINPDTSYCAGAAAVLPFTIEGKFNSGNIFTAQISNSNGNFNTLQVKNIGTLVDTLGGDISITLPSYSSSGHFRIRVRSSNPSWSSFSSSCGQLIHISLPPNPPGIITAIRDTICLGTKAKLSYSIADPLQWQVSTTGNFSSISDSTNTTYSPLMLSVGNFYFRVLDTESGGCVVPSAPYRIFVPPTLTANFTYTVSGNTVTFNSSGSIGDITTWYWDFGDGYTSSVANPVHTYAKDTTYNVCLTIYDGSNCSYTYCRNVIPATIFISVDSSYIAGATVSLPISLNSVYNSANKFKVQFSSSSLFPTPINIGVLPGNSGGNANIRVPPGTPSGTYYLRVISTIPEVYSVTDSITVHP